MNLNKTKSSKKPVTSTTNFEGGTSYRAESPDRALYKVATANFLENSFYQADEELFYPTLISATRNKL